MLSLRGKGFYPHQGKLLSNQGEVMVATEEGVVYTLRFGEVVFASGEELSAGVEESAEKEKAKKDAKKPEGATESRYLMVTVAFDPTLIPEPKPEPEAPLTIPDDPFQLAPDDPKRIAEEKAEKEKADRRKADQDKKIADGQEACRGAHRPIRQLVLRHSRHSFRSIALDRPALLKAKGEKPAVARWDARVPHRGCPTSICRTRDDGTRPSARTGVPAPNTHRTAHRPCVCPPGVRVVPCRRGKGTVK